MKLSLAPLRAARTALALVALGVMGQGCAVEVESEPSASEDDLVGGKVANGEFVEVVMLESAGSSPGSVYVCTGTVIGLRTVLTARHCVEKITQPDGSCKGTVFVDIYGRGGSKGQRYAYERCAFVEGSLAKSDVGLIRVDKPFVGVVPARLADTSPGDATYTTYGYGTFGAKKLNHTCTESIDGNKRVLTYEGKLNFRWGALTCPGDSGGPHFLAGTHTVAGVTSRDYTLYMRNAEVADHRAFIDATLARFERP
jgi:V8-like Glu-specific endopeptidase